MTNIKSGEIKLAEFRQRLHVRLSTRTQTATPVVLM